MSNRITVVTDICIRQLFNDGNLDKGSLANLRTSKSINDRYAAKIWPMLFSSINEVYGHEQDQILSKTGSPTYAEIAIYTALKCYAIYQQGIEEKVFGTKEDEASSFFSALRQVKIADQSVRKALDRRVNATFVMTNSLSLINSILHLMQILKSKKISPRIKIDFGQLANDLYWFQIGRVEVRKVALRWGQSYYLGFERNKKN